MTRIIRIVAPAFLWLAVLHAPLAAQTPGPPAWDDKASVYLAMSQNAAKDMPQPSDDTTAAESNSASALPAPQPLAPRSAVNTPAAPPAQALGAASAPTSADHRHLAPPSARMANRHDATGNQPSPSGVASRRLADYGIPTQSLYTIVSALTIVIGAFLLFAWAMRRAGRISARRNQLPADVVSVLGRVPLATRQFAELLRIGNKLVLVSLTPTGPKTITEVTDPAEVDRLVGLCQQSNPFSTTQAFEQVFQQMSTEPTAPGFLGSESLLTSLASPAGAYRANRGGTSRG